MSIFNGDDMYCTVASGAQDLMVDSQRKVAESLNVKARYLDPI